jgi:imidazolonepropionase-like amidohydrolase
MHTLGLFQLRTKTKLTALCLSLLGFAIACTSTSNQPVELMKVSSGIVLQDVTVVNTRDGSLARGMAVVIDNGKIKKILPNSAVTLLAGAQGISASGKYVVPGFLDMHTHAIFDADKKPAYWPMFLSHGITGIRDMAGSVGMIQRARQLNAELAAGRLDAPEILALPGDIFGGQAPTAALAANFLKQQKANGADFFKIVAGSRPAILGILEEAKAQGMDVAGHLVPTVTALEASNAGWRAVEHLGSGWGFLLDCANDEVAVRQALMNGQGARPPFPPTYTMSPRLYDGAANAPLYQRIFDSYNPTKCQALAQVFEKNATWQVPTLIRLKTMSFSSDKAFRADANLQYVDKTTRTLWEKLANEYDNSMPSTAAATLQQFYGLQLKAVKLLQTYGVKILSGSDVGGIWVIPGVSLHQEFRELATAGLTPLQVLQSTTLNGAEFMRREATMGTVEVGKNADLVLLDANPIVDVANLGKIAGVVLKGRYLSKSYLDKAKADTAQAHATEPLRNLSAAIDLNHKH